MGGFSNAILGGASKLIRKAIQSPNFLHNVSGWTVNDDGSAEFNNVLIRGTISGSDMLIPSNGGPGSGIPYIEINNAGIKAYDSGGNLILELAPNNTSALLTRHVYALDLSSELDLIDGAVPNWFLGWDGLPAAGKVLTRVSPLGTKGQIISAGRPPGTVDQVAFGSNGLGGGYYYEEWELAVQAINNNALTALTGMTATRSQNDYGVSAMVTVTGTWTCPETGQYTFTVYVVMNLAVAAFRTLVRVLNTTAGNKVIDLDMESVSGNITASATKYLTAGDQVTFNYLQAAGAAHNVVDGYISVQRQL